MRVNEKAFAKLQKYMLFAAAFLFAFVFVAEFLFNGVSIKTKNDDVLPQVSSSNKTFYSAGSMYDINYLESESVDNEDHHIPFIHPAEEVVVAYFTDADYITATVTVVPGTAAKTQAATQPATTAAKKNSTSNTTPKPIIIVATLPIATEEPTTAMVEPTTGYITTEPSETEMTSCSTEPSSTTEPVSTSESTTQSESTIATDVSTEPSESIATTASTEPSESTAPTETSTAVTETTEPTESTSETDVVTTGESGEDKPGENKSVVNAGGKSENKPGTVKPTVPGTTVDSSTQSTTATGATDVNGEKNNELRSGTQTNNNLAKKSTAFASVFTPVVIIILVILTVIGIFIRYQLQKRANKKMRHIRKD